MPDRIHRQFASLAAVLEGVDRQFGTLVRDLEEFKSNFGALPRAGRKWRPRLPGCASCSLTTRDNLDLAVKIAQLALSIGRHETALEVLRALCRRAHQGVERVRGVALTGNALGPSAQQGVSSKAAGRSKRLAPIGGKMPRRLCALAESWVREDESKARDLFHQAVAVDATEPVTLSRYIEFEIAQLSDNAVVRPGGADDPQRHRPLPQADRGPGESSLGLGQPAPCSICSSRSRTRPWKRLRN